MEKPEINRIRKDINEVFEELEYWIDRAMPKDGEKWEKKPCPKGMCSFGHSLGVGVHIVNYDKRLDWGTSYHIKCGCLVRVK